MGSAVSTDLLLSMSTRRNTIHSYLKVSLGFRDYRQVCKAIVRNFMLGSTDPYVARYFGVFGDEEDGGFEERRGDDQQPFAQQSGHARGTAGSTYGFTQLDIGRLDGEAYERMLDASSQWHIYGGVYSVVEIDFSDGVARITRRIMPPLGHKVCVWWGWCGN